MSEEVVMEYKQDAIVPFWQKLPFFFLFPFRFGPAVFMLCIIAASALAGLALGGFGLVIKGFLVYFGLRYAFNVLELFSQGRFEGESVDYSLWGPEKRPAKLGLVIALFLVVGITLGNSVVTKRIATNAGVQEELLERYKKDHAAELAQLELEQQAFNKRLGLGSGPAHSPSSGASDTTAADKSDGGDADEPEPESIARAAASEAAAATPPEVGPSREEILSQYQPVAGDPLWFKLLPFWYWLTMMALSLVLPAAAIVIALEDKFFKALNPANVVNLIKSMGAAYFALWALFLLIVGARHLAMTAGEHWPMAIRFPVEMAAATYLALVLFAMMGYALYQFHQELGLDVQVDFDSHRQAGGVEGIAKVGSANAAIREQEPKDPLERKVQALLAAGKVKEAIAEIKDEMRFDRLDPVMNTRLHPLYVKMGDQAVTLTHGQQWLTGLARAGKGKEALDALRSLLAIDPNFAVQDGDVVLPTATAAFQKREFEIAMNLVRAFDKRYPKHKDTAGVFFLGAKLMSEHLRQQDKAIRILQTVLTHFPEEAVVAEAKTYLSVLQKVIAQAPRAAPAAQGD